MPAPHLPDLRASDLLGLLPSAAGIAIVVYAEALSGARTFAVRHGYEIDADQELIALGLGQHRLRALRRHRRQRRAVGLGPQRHQRRQVADDGLIGAAVMVVTVLFVTRVLHDLPEADPGRRRRARRVGPDRGEGAAALRRRARRRRRAGAGRLVGVLALGVLPGLGIAVGLSLAILIYRASRPHAAVLGRVPGEHTYTDVARHPENESFPGLLIFRLDGQLFFANAGLAVDRLNELLNATPPAPRW